VTASEHLFCNYNQQRVRPLGKLHDGAVRARTPDGDADRLQRISPAPMMEATGLLPLLAVLLGRHDSQQAPELPRHIDAAREHAAAARREENGPRHARPIRK